MPCNNNNNNLKGVYFELSADNFIWKINYSYLWKLYNSVSCKSGIVI